MPFLLKHTPDTLYWTILLLKGSTIMEKKDRAAVIRARDARLTAAAALIQRLDLQRYIDLTKYSEEILSRLSATEKDRLELFGESKHPYEIVDNVANTYGWDDFGYMVYWMNWKSGSASMKIATERFFNYPTQRQLFCQYGGKTRQVTMVSRLGDIGLSAGSTPMAGYTDRVEFDLNLFYAFRNKVEWRLAEHERYAAAVLLDKNPPSINDRKKFDDWAQGNAIPKYLTELPPQIMELLVFFDLFADESNQYPTR